MSSEDNRAVSILDPSGALVKLTIPLGEANSVGALSNGNVGFYPTGMPSCTANLPPPGGQLRRAQSPGRVTR